MKKTLLFLLLIISAISAEANLRQIVCSNGWRISLGDTIETGKGSLAGGFYNNIWYVPYVKGEVPHGNIDGKHLIVVKEFYTPLKRRARLTLIDDKGQKYRCSIEEAMKSREVIAPKHFWDYRKHPLGPMMSYTGDIAIGDKHTAMQELLSWFRGYYGNDTTGRVNKIDEAKGVFSGVAGFKYKSSFPLGNAGIKGNICYTLNATVSGSNLHYEFTDFIHQPDSMAKMGFAF
ncbi:MAG: hypothetical protein JSS96_17550, partial [Bacteroidetes bacterium]|nr:hypothetical protein [Bacteroidota bacterium]